MKLKTLLLTFLFTSLSSSQDLFIQLNGSVNHLNYFKKFDEEIFGGELGLKYKTDFIPFISRAGVSFQYFDKVFSRQYQDLSGLFETNYSYTIYKIEFWLLYDYRLSDLIVLEAGVGPGIGFYNEQVDNYNSQVNYNLTTNGFCLDLCFMVDFEILENIYLVPSAAYEYFSPSYTIEKSSSVRGGKKPGDYEIDLLGYRFSFGVMFKI